MLSFRRYAFLMFVLLLAATLYLPWRLGVAYPKTLGPTLTDPFHAAYKTGLVKSQADVALIGDSILHYGVDPARLAQLTGRKVYKLDIPGSASAAWYLAIKNVFAAVPHKPRYVIVTFRDTILTVPGYRVNGKYFDLVSQLATPQDEFFLQRAFIQEMSLPEQLADQYLPLYGSRLNLREKIDHATRYAVPALLGCDAACNDQANVTVFGGDNLDQNLLVDAVASAESYLYTPDRLDFDRQVGQSFLPEMVRIARSNNIQLILVRTKHLDDLSEASESAALQGYIQALKAYAAGNKLIYIDFSHDPRLTKDLYFDNYHTNKAGMAVFTQILAEALLPILKQ
jgi:hypothetical protein